MADGLRVGLALPSVLRLRAKAWLTGDDCAGAGACASAQPTKTGHSLARSSVLTSPLTAANCRKRARSCGCTQARACHRQLLRDRWLRLCSCQSSTYADCIMHAAYKRAARNSSYCNVDPQGLLLVLLYSTSLELPLTTPSSRALLINRAVS